LKNILKYVIGFRTDTKSKKLVAIITLVLGILLFGIGCSLTTKTNNVEVSKNITASVTQKDNSTDNVVVKTDTIDTSKETITPITKVDTTTADTSTNEQLKVSYINVGQADSILVEQGSSSMLIDAGNNGDSETVKNYVENQGITTLDFLVGTHPHEDHIGGMDYIINAFKIGKIYMPKATTTTQTFNDVITAIKNKNMQITTPIVGDSFKLGQATCTILSPNNSTYEDLNNYSVVIKITFKDNTFIFEGDAGAVSEMEMVNKGYDLKSDLLKVGHHGSSSSTTSAFLKAIFPKYSVISVGGDNDYGHPTQETLNKLSNAGVQVYRTDQEGTIVATSDGETVTFTAASSPLSTPEPEQPVPVPATVTGSLMISRIDLSGEVVTLTNSSDKVLNLTGWKLVSEVGNQTFTFPADTTLAEGGTLKIVSGKNAQAGANVLVWTESNIWNNDGDPGALYNPGGQMVSKK